MPASRAPQRTRELERCIAVARAQAWREDLRADVVHLMLATVFTDDRSCRSRLTLRSLGVHHFLTADGYATFTAAASADAPDPHSTPMTEAAEAVLDRLGYWMTRTGDQTADTVHLLLACLETAASNDDVREVATEFGITIRDVVRDAMTVQYSVSAADRQARVRGPILSPARADRPAAYQFENPWKENAGPRRANSIRLRSQVVGTFDLGSPVHLYLLRMHLWALMTASAAHLAQLAAIGYATITVTPWSAVWVVGTLRRFSAPALLRLTITAGLLALSLPLGIPRWLVIGALVLFVLDTIEGRLALLEVRGDVADPAVSPRDLLRDGRINARASRQYQVLKVTRNLEAG